MKVEIYSYHRQLKNFSEQQFKDEDAYHVQLLKCKCKLMGDVSKNKLYNIDLLTEDSPSRLDLISALWMPLGPARFPVMFE